MELLRGFSSGGYDRVIVHAGSWSSRLRRYLISLDVLDLFSVSRVGGGGTGGVGGGGVVAPALRRPLQAPPPPPTEQHRAPLGGGVGPTAPISPARQPAPASAPPPPPSFPRPPPPTPPIDRRTLSSPLPAATFPSVAHPCFFCFYLFFFFYCFYQQKQTTTSHQPTTENKAQTSDRHLLPNKRKHTAQKLNQLTLKNQPSTLILQSIHQPPPPPPPPPRPSPRPSAVGRPGLPRRQSPRSSTPVFIPTPPR